MCYCTTLVFHTLQVRLRQTLQITRKKLEQMTALGMSPLQCRDLQLSLSGLDPELSDATCRHCWRVEEVVLENLGHIPMQFMCTSSSGRSHRPWNKSYSWCSVLSLGHVLPIQQEQHADVVAICIVPSHHSSCLSSTDADSACL